MSRRADAGLADLGFVRSGRDTTKGQWISGNRGRYTALILATCRDRGVLRGNLLRRTHTHRDHSKPVDAGRETRFALGRVGMAIHAIDRTATDDLDTDLYASTLECGPLPKRSLADTGVPPAVAYALVRDELILDGNSRQNLATFCTTWMEPEVRQLMADSIDKNMIDKDEYPQTAEIESRCVHILADLWHAPAAMRAVGCSPPGSSEAAMLGGPNLVCGPVQVCWEKFARYFDVELRCVPIEADATGEHRVGDHH